MVLAEKDPSEIITVTFDFAAVASSVVSAAVTASVISGTSDATPSAILASEPGLSGSSVMQRVTAGQGGTTYGLRCVATDSDGEKYVLTAAIPVKTADPLC